jgi:hypothetical protein
MYYLKHTGGSSKDITVADLTAANMTPRQMVQFNKLLDKAIIPTMTPFEVLEQVIINLKLITSTDHNQQGNTPMLTLHNQTKRLIKQLLAIELSKPIAEIDAVDDEVFDNMIDVMGGNFTPKTLATVFTHQLMKQVEKRQCPNVAHSLDAALSPIVAYLVMNKYQGDILLKSQDVLKYLGMHNLPINGTNIDIAIPKV